MPRQDANPYILGEIGKDHVELAYFVHIAWDIGGGNEYRVNSTGTDITDPAGPYEYKGVGCRVITGEHNEIGNACRVIVPDEDRLVRSYIDVQGLEVAAHVRQAYLDARTYQSSWLFQNTMVPFSGIVSGAPRIGLTVELELTQAVSNRLIPHIIFAAPTTNWNAKPGARFDYWRGEIEVQE